MRFKEIQEQATAGATASGNIATVTSPHIAIGKARGKKLKDATAIVGITKARNKGFYPKANDARVSKPPKRMANKGFIK